MTLADDVATLVGWPRHDLLAVAGPCPAERCALYDFLVAELPARAPPCPHRLQPLGTYLVNQGDAVLAFAQRLDTDLATVAGDFQVSPAVVRAVCTSKRSTCATGAAGHARRPCDSTGAGGSTN